ncbi:MAG: hypothetical protein RLZZ31_179 [Actinomycetota bacterium]
MAASRSSRSDTADAVNSSVDSFRIKEPTIDTQQRSRLQSAKLRALLTQHLESEIPLPISVGAGAGVIVETKEGASSWVLGEGERCLGPSVIWSQRHDVVSINVAIDDVDVAAVVARRASAFALPLRIWHIEGKTLVPATPALMAMETTMSAEAQTFLELLQANGLDVIVERGSLRGELRGLEIARVIDAEDGARLEVGVGRHDREAFTMVHGNIPPAEALSRVVESVDAVRKVDAHAHPLRRLAPEGWMRWRLLREPELVDAEFLEPIASPMTVESVNDVAPSFALGRTSSGAPLIVACSVGVDPDVVPTAADARLCYDDSAQLVIVVPERDAHPVTLRLATALQQPAEVMTLPGEWRGADS